LLPHCYHENGIQCKRATTTFLGNGKKYQYKQQLMAKLAKLWKTVKTGWYEFARVRACPF